MTPAAVWAQAYNDMYLATLTYYQANGYGSNDLILCKSGDTRVRDICRERATEYAFETRDLWVEKNPGWLEQLPK